MSSKGVVDHSVIEFVNLKYPDECSPIEPSNAPVVLSWSNLTVSINVSYKYLYLLLLLL